MLLRVCTHPTPAAGAGGTAAGPDHAGGAGSPLSPSHPSLATCTLDSPHPLHTSPLPAAAAAAALLLVLLLVLLLLPVLLQVVDLITQRALGTPPLAVPACCAHPPHTPTRPPCRCWCYCRSLLT